MKRFLVVALLVALFASLAALLAMTSGGNAAPSKSQYGKDAPTGDYLDLFACSVLHTPAGCVNSPPTNNDAYYPADTPFHLNGGWLFDKGKNVPKDRAVQFQLDGSEVVSPYPAVFTYKDTQGQRWVQNFPDGLPASTHTFTINYTPCHWTGPGPISETPRWTGCTLSMQVTFR